LRRRLGLLAEEDEPGCEEVGELNGGFERDRTQEALGTLQQQSAAIPGLAIPGDRPDESDD